MLVLGIFGLDYLLLPLWDTFPMRALRDMSKNINTVYCIQWTLIGMTGILLSGVLFPEDGLAFAPMTLLAAVVVAISGEKILQYKAGENCAWLYSRHRNGHQSDRTDAGCLAG